MKRKIRKDFYKIKQELGLKEDIDIEMRAFELDPNASYEVVSRTDEKFAVKYGLTLNAARERIEGISLLGRREGIDFKYIDTQYTRRKHERS